jgi:ornithine cyclodeaminase
MSRLLRDRGMCRMIHFDAAELQRRLQFRPLIARMADAMRHASKAPVRQRLTDPLGREFLSMPAMLGNYAGLKSLTIVPENRGTPRPVISGLFTLFSLQTGEALATVDATELTARRTSAMSATAAHYLAKPDASRLLVLGAGHLAPYMAAAIACVRPIRSIQIWARNPEAASKTVSKATTLLEDGDASRIEVASDLEAAARTSDIISSATSATAPLIKGDWLRPGMHLDLVGSYRPDMREIDDTGIARASLFVDDLPAVLSEAGDLIDPIRRGIIAAEDIVGDLTSLCMERTGRRSDQDITLFKSVGTATADLIAAITAWEH